MKLTKMGYSRVFSLGNYENEKISVECEFEENSNPTDIYLELKQVIDNAHNLRGDLRKFTEAKKIVSNQDLYRIGQVKEAKEYIIEFQDKYLSISDVKLHALLSENNDPITESEEKY
jgi:hypothetical protein